MIPPPAKNQHPRGLGKRGRFTLQQRNWTELAHHFGHPPHYRRRPSDFFALIQWFVQVGSEKLVDNAAGRCMEDLYPARVVPKNYAVLTYAQPRQAFKAALKGRRVAASMGQT